MRPDELEDRAYRGQEMPDGLNAPEQMLFQAFRWLYAYAKLVKMPPDRGRREKQALLREFDKRQCQTEHLEKTWAMWKQIEAAANRYGRERTLEHADAFVRAVYGAGVKKNDEIS